MSRVNLNCIAAGKVTGADGVASNVRGATTARTGAGVYTVTPDQQIDATETCLVANAVGTTAAIVNVQNTSDSVKTVRIFDAAGMAADSDFNFALFDVGE